MAYESSQRQVEYPLLGAGCFYGHNHDRSEDSEGHPCRFLYVGGTELEVYV